MSDLSSYVKVFPQWIELLDCDATITELTKADWEKHVFYNANSKTFVNLSGDNELENSFYRPYTYGLLASRCQDAVNQYIKDLDHFWFSGWTGCSDIRFNKYSENTKMSEHCDHIRTIFDGERKGVPILSCLGILNDDYEGGEFIMNGNKMELYAGDVIVFPSNFMYPHKVEPVKTGTRYSFISWFW